MKNYQCIHVLHCGVKVCAHKVLHESNMSCDHSTCIYIGQKVKCINIRKSKLKKLGDVVSSREVE